MATTRGPEAANESILGETVVVVTKCKIRQFFRATLAHAARNHVNSGREAAREARRLTPLIEKGRRASRFN